MQMRGGRGDTVQSFISNDGLQWSRQAGAGNRQVGTCNKATQEHRYTNKGTKEQRNRAGMYGKWLIREVVTGEQMVGPVRWWEQEDRLWQNTPLKGWIPSPQAGQEHQAGWVEVVRRRNWGASGLGTEGWTRGPQADGLGAGWSRRPQVDSLGAGWRQSRTPKADSLRSWNQARMADRKPRN